MIGVALCTNASCGNYKYLCIENKKKKYNALNRIEVRVIFVLPSYLNDISMHIQYSNTF